MIVGHGTPLPNPPFGVFPFPKEPPRKSHDELIEDARQWSKTATPEQLREMHEAQRASWVRGEMVMGETSVVATPTAPQEAKALTPADVHPSHAVRDEGFIYDDPFCQKCRAGVYTTPGALRTECIGKTITKVQTLIAENDKWWAKRFLDKATPGEVLAMRELLAETVQ